MATRTTPVDTWMVVEPVTDYEIRPVSIHTTQREAEAERDRRNKNLNEPRYTACIALEPVAERMGRPLRLLSGSSQTSERDTGAGREMS
jgi:hypothetical protein